MKCQAENTEIYIRYEKRTVELETNAIAMDPKSYGSVYINGNNKYCTKFAAQERI
jgi:hypothetical protein